MAQKKVYIQIKSNEQSNPIKMALEQVTKLTQQVVDDPEDADVIVVNSSSDALTMLKENDEAIVVIAVNPWEKSDETGARSLKKAYPNRVVIGQMLDFKVEPESGDVPLVLYLMGMIKEGEEK